MQLWIIFKNAKQCVKFTKTVLEMWLNCIKLIVPTLTQRYPKWSHSLDEFVHQLHLDLFPRVFEPNLLIVQIKRLLLRLRYSVLIAKGADFGLNLTHKVAIYFIQDNSRNLQTMAVPFSLVASTWWTRHVTLLCPWFWIYVSLSRPFLFCFVRFQLFNYSCTFSLCPKVVNQSDGGIGAESRET